MPSSRCAPGGVGWPGAGRLGAGVIGRSPGAVVGGTGRPGVVPCGVGRSAGRVSDLGLQAGIAATIAARQSKTKSLFMVFSFPNKKSFNPRLSCSRCHL